MWNTIILTKMTVDLTAKSDAQTMDTIDEMVEESEQYTNE